MSSVSPLPPTIVAEGKGPGQALCAIIAAAAPRWGRGRVDRHRRRRGCRGFPAAGCRDFRPVRAEPALRGAPAARWYRALAWVVGRGSSPWTVSLACERMGEVCVPFAEISGVPHLPLNRKTAVECN